MKTERQLREEIVEIGKLAYQKGWVAANDGNFSVRLDADRILCTPTMISKGMMTPDDLIIVDYQGNKVEGTRERTSEIAMHLTIYGMRPDIQSVVHVHPPTATGFAAAGRALNMALLPEVVICLGSIPLAGYGLPGTPALTEAMLPFIPKFDAMLMQNHGAVAYGSDLWDAFFKMETIEHIAKITLVAEQVGGARPLPRRDVEALFESRARYGVKGGAKMSPGNPVVAEDLRGTRDQKFELTREELLSLIDEALRARGVLS